MRANTVQDCTKSAVQDCAKGAAQDDAKRIVQNRTKQGRGIGPNPGGKIRVRAILLPCPTLPLRARDGTLAP
jgi:hypothetical protein